MNPSKKGVALVALGALLWGGSGVAAQFLLQQKGFSTEWLVMMRMTLAGILLLNCPLCQGHFERRDLFHLLLFLSWRQWIIPCF